MTNTLVQISIVIRVRNINSAESDAIFSALLIIAGEFHLELHLEFHLELLDEYEAVTEVRRIFHPPTHNGGRDKGQGSPVSPMRRYPPRPPAPPSVGEISRGARRIRP